MSNLIKTDKSYRQWISDITRRFRQSQLKAAVKVNDEMLRFYWSVGRDINKMSDMLSMAPVSIKRSAVILRISFLMSSPFRRQILSI